MASLVCSDDAIMPQLQTELYERRVEIKQNNMQEQSIINQWVRLER